MNLFHDLKTGFWFSKFTAFTNNKLTTNKSNAKIKKKDEMYKTNKKCIFLTNIILTIVDS